MPRPRKPTKLKVVTGTAQKSRINDAEPQLESVIPECPETLPKEAKKYWKTFCLVLQKMGVLTEADGFALASLCKTFGRIKQLEKELKARKGMTYKTVSQTGGVMHRLYPEVTAINEAERLFANQLSKFGLTPADRSRVSGKKDKGKSGWDGL